jgi:hypothetical protein
LASYILAMEIFEAITGVLLGFVPTPAAMDDASKLSRRVLTQMEVRIR